MAGSGFDLIESPASLDTIDSRQHLCHSPQTPSAHSDPGGARQPLPWIAKYADGWLTYPDTTHDAQGPARLAAKIQAWRSLIPDGGFRPHVTNEWLDLVDDANHPRVPMHGGHTLRTGRKGLIALLEAWRAAGVNHAALGIQYSQRPAAEVIQEIAEEVLPLFPAFGTLSNRSVDW